MLKKNVDWSKLAEAAWEVRENAAVIGKTKVGAALLSSNGNIYAGCNVEQRYRNHDVHAEVNAICNMILNGEKELVAIVVVAERIKFTPCGSCLDWIFQFGGPDTLVGYQNSKGEPITSFKASELMPHYPE